MNINSAVFIKGLVGPDESLENGIPQIAFIGRSNVGKSSVINTLAGKKDLARTSPLPGRTREINLFLINNAFYLVDLPGYGFAKASKDMQEQIQRLIYWYFFESGTTQKKVVLIVDANIGLTKIDEQMLFSLEAEHKDIVIVANKIDKIKKTALQKQLKEIQSAVGKYKIIPYSALERIGISELANELLK